MQLAANAAPDSSIKAANVLRYRAEVSTGQAMKKLRLSP